MNLNSYSFASDLDDFMPKLASLPVEWDGKACVLELKEADYNWKQMEWWAFYFEFKVLQKLKNICSIPGDRIERVEFDMKTQINWDIKAKAIKSDDHKVILNDTIAMQESISNHGFHGEIIGLCDVEYNDRNRSFQRWHTELKGGLSQYEIKRMAGPSTFSRYRKTSAVLSEIIYILFDENDLEKLNQMNQGRNSNDKPRPPKYMLDLEHIDDFQHEKQEI
ncbi:MAG: hypothetical protein F4X92_09935 [Gammaproteobacteria bacterium]|nr:hypothetical protein [Gammaproteobacteria bacterium]